MFTGLHWELTSEFENEALFSVKKIVGNIKRRGWVVISQGTKVTSDLDVC